MKQGQARGARIVVALIALELLAVAATPAAGDGGAKSRIKMSKLHSSGATGKVKSHNRRCLGGRKVTLFYFEDFVTRKAAITESRRNGRWRVRKPLAPGRYFAKVDGTKGCRYDISPTSRL